MLFSGEGLGNVDADLCVAADSRARCYAMARWKIVAVQCSGVRPQQQNNHKNAWKRVFTCAGAASSLQWHRASILVVAK